jgi:hypothetical protein
MKHMFAQAVHPRSAFAVIVVSGCLLLSGCSSPTDAEVNSDPTPPEAGPSAPAGGTSQPVNPHQAYGLDLPPDLKLTPLGTDLKLGETARVAWEPKPSTVGALAITVTRLRKGTLKDFADFTLDEQTKKSTPYYVDAKVKNIGASKLSKVPPPLYLVDGTNALVQASTFESDFKPCNAGPLPRRFKPGKSTKVCLVYLVADKGKLNTVSFRPTQKYAPITWTGVPNKQR